MSPVDSNMSNPLNCMIEIEKRFGHQNAYMSREVKKHDMKRLRAFENRITKKLPIVQLEYQDPKKPKEKTVSKDFSIDSPTRLNKGSYEPSIQGIIEMDFDKEEGSFDSKMVEKERI